jgi:hypothetical protein
MVYIVVIKYINMLSKSDKMFQKTFLSGIYVRSIAQSLWSGLEKNLIGLKDGMCT